MPNAFDELEAAPKKRNVFDELESPRRNVFDELEEIFASQGEPEPLSTPAEDRATLENYLRATTPRDDRFRQPQDLLKQPDVLGVFGGDREPMTRDNLGRVGSSIVDSLAQGGIGLQEGFKSLGEQGWTGIQAANEPILELGPISVTASGIQPTALARSKAEGAREIAKEAKRGSEDLAQLSKETGGSQFMRQLGQGIPSVAPAIAAGPLGLPAVIGAAGAQGGLSTLAQAQDVFEQDPEERGGALLPNPAFRSALAPAAADAIQTAAITLVAGKLFGQGIEGATLPVKRAAIQRMVGGKLREALGEAVEEGVQQLISDAVIKRMSYDPEASLEEAISGALDAAAVGGVLGAGVSTIRDAGERSTSKLPPTFAEWNREQRGIARDAARALAKQLEEGTALPAPKARAPERRVGIRIPDPNNVLLQAPPDLLERAMQEAQSPIEVPGRVPAIDLLRRELDPTPLIQPEPTRRLERPREAGETTVRRAFEGVRVEPGFERSASDLLLERRQPEISTPEKAALSQFIAEEVAANRTVPSELQRRFAPAPYRQPRTPKSTGRRAAERRAIEQGMEAESGFYLDEPRNQSLPEPPPPKPSEGTTIINPETGRVIVKPTVLSNLQRQRLRKAFERGADEQTILNIIRSPERKGGSVDVSGESLSVASPEAPAMQFAREIPQMSADEFRQKGSSFNKQNIELGLRATPENIEELKQLREQAMNRAREAAKRMATAQTDADLQSITTEMQMPQFYNEAIAIAETLANNNIRYDGKTVGKNRTVHNFTLMDGDQEGGSFTMSETDLMPDRIAKKAQDVRATFAESLSEPATAAELKRIEQEGASLSQGQPLTDETPYEIFDTQTGEVVFEGLYKNRSRIRQAAEQRNKNYGAYRYAPRVKPVIGQDASLKQSEDAPVHELSEPPSRQELESKVKELRQKHPGMLEIRIADDYHGLPDRAHQAAYRQGANPAGIKGFVDGKTVWLNRQMLDSVEDAIATIWHEQFGHFATDKKLGRRLTRFMSQVRESFRDTELMRDTESRYRNADDVRLGREFVARIAENPNSNPGAWKRLVAMVRQWLRDIGFVKTVTENDIQALLRGAIDSLAAQESGVEPSLSVKSTKSDLPISTPENIGETSEMPPSPGKKTKPSRGKWFAGKNPVETAAMMQERANAFQKGKSDQQIIEDLAGWMSGNPNINLDSEAANFVIKDMLAKIGKSINPKQSTPQTMEKWAQIDRLSEMARRVGEQSGRELVSRRLAFNDINWLMPLLSWRGLAQKTWRKQLGLDENASVVDAVKDAATGKTRLPKLEVNAKIADLGKKFEEGKITEGQLLDGIAKELGLPPLSGETATKLMELAKQAESKPEGVLRNKILQQMVDEIQRTTPASPFDIIRDYWYNNALSGSRTLAAILTGSWIHGAIMATQEAADAALQGNFKAARYIPLAFMLDTFEGIANAVDVIRTGDYTRRAEFAENIQRALGQKGKLDSLEGWWKHGNKLQKALALTTFVRRAVVGLDYIGAIATRGSGVIYNALLESPQQLDQALKRFDKEASAQAKKQAQAELGPKAKWVDVRARQLEILEQGINQEIKENAKTLGEIAALNAPPVGLGAVAYKALEYIPRAIQSNFRTSKEAAQFAGFVGRAAAGLAFARAAINMAANASNWMPLVGGINWGRALVGKRIPQEHWARVFGLYDEKGEPLSDDRRRLIFASHAMGLALVASVYALTQLGDDDDEKRFDVQGTWKGLSAKERKAKIDAGLRPLSIQVGGKTIRYDNLPVASALAVVGNIRDKERKDGKRMTPDDAITRITDGWASGIFYIKDLTPIRGFVDALGYSSMNTDEGADAINRWASQFARSGAALIPFASAQREIDTFFDPSHYKPRRSIDYWVRSIPWVRRYGGVGPEYNMAGLPIENPLWPSTRFIPADLPDDPVVDALSSLVARGVFPKHPDPSPTWIKDGERRSASEFPKETYRFQTEVLKAWRREMLRDAELLKKFTADEYEDYYRRYLAPLTQQIKAEIQNEIDPEALDYRGRVRQDYLKP